MASSIGISVYDCWRDCRCFRSLSVASVFFLIFHFFLFALLGGRPGLSFSFSCVVCHQDAFYSEAVWCSIVHPFSLLLSTLSARVDSPSFCVCFFFFFVLPSLSLSLSLLLACIAGWKGLRLNFALWHDSGLQSLSGTLPSVPLPFDRYFLMTDGENVSMLFTNGQLTLGRRLRVSTLARSLKVENYA